LNEWDGFICLLQDWLAYVWVLLSVSCCSRQLGDARRTTGSLPFSSSSWQSSCCHSGCWWCAAGWLLPWQADTLHITNAAAVEVFMQPRLHVSMLLHCKVLRGIRAVLL
jgi:hypothetical protein